MYKKILDDNNQIIGIFNAGNNAQIPLSSDNHDYIVFMNWLADNNLTLNDLEIWPPQTPEVIQAKFAQAVERHIDSVARQKDYDNGLSCATYASSSIMQWQQEAQAFVVWRDLVWQYAIAQLALIQTNQRAMPTVEDFILELPAMNWPE